MSEQIDVFISYKREERVLAEQVAAALEAAGYTQVTDLNLSNSEHFGDAIDRMLRASRLVLVLWTPAAATSDWVKSEARLGVELGTYLGVMVEPAELPVDLKFKQYVDLGDTALAQALPQITNAVAEKLGPPKISAGIAANQSTALNDDLRLFETAERLNSVASYGAYLGAFPNGVMAQLASKRRSNLKTWQYRVRRVLPGAGWVGSIAALMAIGVQLFLNEQDDVIAELNTRIGDQRTTITQLRDDIENSGDTQQFLSLRADFTATQAELVQLKAERDEARAALERARASASDQLSGAVNEVDALKARIAMLQANGAESEAKLGVLETVQEQLNDAQSRLAAAEAAQASTAEKLEEQQVAEKTKDFRIAELSTQLNAALAKGAAAERALDLAEDRIAGLSLPPENGAVGTQSVFPDRLFSDLSTNATRPRERPDFVADRLPDCTTDNNAPGIDLPKLGCVSLQETSLDLSDADIADSDLARIAEFTSLWRLNLDSTSITDISPLSALVKLQRLDLDNTQVADISPLSGLSEMRHLYLTGAPVTDIGPLRNLRNLVGLDLNGTQVADISPLASLANLRSIDLDGTPLANLGALSGNTGLRVLSIRNTSIADLSAIGQMPGLETLYISNVPIADIGPLAQNTALQRLSLRGTKVADLAPLAGNQELQALWLERTQVTDFSPLRDLEKLHFLTLPDGATLGDLSSDTDENRQAVRDWISANSTVRTR